MNHNIRDLLLTESTFAQGERLRHLVIGSREGVIETIHTLHHLKYAEAGLWSALLPAPVSGEVTSILTRCRQQD